MNKIKPEINKDDVLKLLTDIYQQTIDRINEADSGKIKKVYSFEKDDKTYVIRFHNDNVEFLIEKYIEDKLCNSNFPIPAVYYTGRYNNLYYSITDKVSGIPINSVSQVEIMHTMPSIMDSMTKFHSADISLTHGYGWLDKNLNGSFKSFREYLDANFSNDLPGFWNGWYKLFDSSIMNYSTYEKLFNLMMDYAPYSEGRRYIAHTDFHWDHILIHEGEVTGIIDWGRTRYLDYMFDIVTIVMEFPDLKLISEFKNYYKEKGFDIENFEERFICSAIFQSLDAMRFWAKIGGKDSYQSILDSIKDLLTNEFGIKI